MHLENLKKWLNGGYVSPPDFKDSLETVIKDYEQLKKEMFKIKKKEVFKEPRPINRQSVYYNNNR